MAGIRQVFVEGWLRTPRRQSGFLLSSLVLSFISAIIGYWLAMGLQPPFDMMIAFAAHAFMIGSCTCAAIALPKTAVGLLNATKRNEVGLLLHVLTAVVSVTILLGAFWHVLFLIKLF